MLDHYILDNKSFRKVKNTPNNKSFDREVIRSKNNYSQFSNYKEKKKTPNNNIQNSNEVNILRNKKTVTSHLMKTTVLFNSLVL